MSKKRVTIIYKKSIGEPLTPGEHLYWFFTEKWGAVIAIPGTIFALAFLITWLEIKFEPKIELPEKYANMTAEDLPRLQKELFDEARKISDRREKMTSIMLALPDDRPTLTDDFFISRGTTKSEFLEYFEIPESELYD